MIPKYTIYKHIGSISKSNNGWVKELNKVGEIESQCMILGRGILIILNMEKELLLLALN